MRGHGLSADNWVLSGCGVLVSINWRTLHERPWTLRQFMSTEDKVPVADFLELSDTLSIRWTLRQTVDITYALR